MSATLTTVASKADMLKERRTEQGVIDAVAQKQAVAAGTEEPPPAGCFAKFVSCALFSRRGTRVSTREDAAAVGARMESAAQSGLLNRLVGVRKKGAPASEKLQVATQCVSTRVSGLRDRVAAARKRAIAAKTAGRREEALRELKKAKALEKQLLVAQAALDTLERQADLLAESALQKELATALQSTTQQVKVKSKGVLEAAEAAIDDAHEVRDDVADIAQVFEGLTPDDGFDEDELEAELEAMMGGGEEGASDARAEGSVAMATGSASVAASAPSKPMAAALPAAAFPSVPTDAREQRMALLAEAV